MNTRLKKLFFLIIPLMGIVLLAPSAFAKHHHHKHCNPDYGNSYSDRSHYDRPYYDRSYYGRGRYNDRYDDRYDDDDYSRRRTPRYQPRDNDSYYGGGSSYPNNGYYGGSSYPQTGNFPWWELLTPRY